MGGIKDKISLLEQRECREKGMKMKFFSFIVEDVFNLFCLSTDGGGAE